MKTFISALFSAFLLGGLANAQTVVIDDVFGDGNPETNTDGTVAPGIDGSYYIVSANEGVVTPGPGIPEVTEPGPLLFDPSANGNWARGELISKHDFPLPTAGETRTFSWTIGPISPSSIGVPGDDYRIQLNAINADRTQDTAGDGIGRSSERFVLDGTDSGASAISLDMYFEEDNEFFENPFLLAQLWEKDSTWAFESNGVQLDSTGNGGDLNFGMTGWNWWEDSNTYSLTMSDTGYTWSDTVTGFNFSRDYTAQTAADFANGYWAHTHGQNRDFGRGSHEMSRFLVTETSNSLAGDYDGDGLVSAGDLNLVLNNWGTEGTPAGWINDLPVGIISAEELNGVLNAWGNSATALAVPEPSSLGLAFLGLLLFARRRS